MVLPGNKKAREQDTGVRKSHLSALLGDRDVGMGGQGPGGLGSTAPAWPEVGYGNFALDIEVRSKNLLDPENSGVDAETHEISHLV